MLKRTVFALCLAAGPALSQDAETVVATVNGQDITLGQMIATRQETEAQAPTDLPDVAMWDLVLDQLIRQTAVAYGADVQLDAGDRARIALIERGYLGQQALVHIAKAEPSEEEIAAYFAQAFGGAEPQQEYHAAHILLETREAADAIKAQLDEGVDFAKLAQERSTGPSGPGGGDLGWFTADRMVKPFAEAVAALQPGEVSQPVETKFGWHVIKLLESRMQDVPELGKVRDQIVTQLRRKRVDEAIQKAVAEAEIKKIEGLKPELLRQDTLLDAK